MCRSGEPGSRTERHESCACVDRGNLEVEQDVIVLCVCRSGEPGSRTRRHSLVSVAAVR